MMFGQVGRLLTILLVLAWPMLLTTPSHAADEANAATGPALNVAVFVNSRTDRCYSRGYEAAARKLANYSVEQINNRGGIAGRRLEIKIYDNRAKEDLAVQNIREALQEKELLAMIGLSSSQRSSTIFSNVGDEIGKSNVPFLSHISVDSIFEKYPNVFSTRPSQEVERIPVMLEFIKSLGVKDVAFIGRSSAAWSEAIGDGIRQQLTSVPMTAFHRIKLHGAGRNAVLDPEQLATAIQDIKETRPGILVLAVGTSLTDEIIDQLKQAGTMPQILTVGRFPKDVMTAARDYKAPIFGMTWSQVPEVESDRAINVMSEGAPEDWLFEGAKVPSAPNWKKGLCPQTHFRDAFSRDNIRAVQRGARFADMLKLIAASASKVGRQGKIDDYRKRVIQDLNTTYRVGRGAFKGMFENWSFHNHSRVRAQTPFVVILPEGLGRTQLMPKQFIRLKDTAAKKNNLKQIETLYLDVDLIRMHSVDNNKKSFFAEFYLAMRVSNLTIDDVSFTNAFLDPRASRDARTNGREISIEVLHKGGKSDAYPKDMRMYKVSGRFRFTPDFSNYPFDRQQFSIDLQPKSGDKPFIIQPPPAELRDAVVTSEGWLPDRHYVSYVEDFVPVVDAFTHNPSVVPFYATRFVWQMKREATDYYIRVVVPLLFILIVAYLSIFIPKSNMDSIITIQITALLAAVALYLSLPAIDTDTATISDRIFMFDYMMVSLMIIVSILRINARIVSIPWVNNVLAFTHIVIMPAVLLALVLYFTKTEILTGFMEMPGWKLLGIG